MVQFQNQSDTQFVLVGCGCELQLKPRKASGGCIYTFLLAANGTILQLLHRTPTDEVIFIPFVFLLESEGFKLKETVLGELISFKIKICNDDV